MGVAVNSHAYSIGQKIDIEYEGNFYIAKIMSIQSGYLYLRYEEWGPDYDEWLPITSPRVRAAPGVIQSISGTEKNKNRMELWGNQTTFNIEKVLHQNILSSEYFKSLFALKTYHEVIDEIYRECTNLEPWAAQGRVPSTAFCLLLKFFTMGLTEKQLQGLLDHTDSPYIRGVGFLYLRYACPPKRLWDFVSPYLDDEEEIILDKMGSRKTTIGGLVRMLLKDTHYFQSILPRIPVPVMRDIQKKLILHERGVAAEELEREAAEKHVRGDSEPHRGDDTESDRNRDRDGVESRRRRREDSFDRSNRRERDYDRRRSHERAEGRRRDDEDRASHRRSGSRGREYDSRERRSSQSDRDEYYRKREVERDIELEIKERMRSQASTQNRSEFMKRPPSVKAALSVKSSAVNIMSSQGKEKVVDIRRSGSRERDEESRRRDRDRGGERETEAARRKKEQLMAMYGDRPAEAAHGYERDADSIVMGGGFKRR